MTQDKLPFDTPIPYHLEEHPLVKVMDQLPIDVLEYVMGLCGVRADHRNAAARGLLKGKVTTELKRACDTYRKVVL